MCVWHLHLSKNTLNCSLFTGGQVEEAILFLGGLKCNRRHHLVVADPLKGVGFGFEV